MAKQLPPLPGEGIGPEGMGGTKAVIDWFNARGAGFSFEEDLVDLAPPSEEEQDAGAISSFRVSATSSAKSSCR